VPPYTRTMLDGDGVSLMELGDLLPPLAQCQFPCIAPSGDAGGPHQE
jgi:hypothetical protein